MRTDDQTAVPSPLPILALVIAAPCLLFTLFPAWTSTGDLGFLEATVVAVFILACGLIYADEAIAILRKSILGMGRRPAR